MKSKMVAAGDDTATPATPKKEVTVSMDHGLPLLTVPLPSRNELCIFALRPVTHSVGDFLNMLKLEDPGQHFKFVI
jgi:hypothetical protein